MALEYKLEFMYDDSAPSDSSVFIQLRQDPPSYQTRIDKEDYDELDDDKKDEFITGLFNVPGIVELSVRAYRVWIMKSPVFYWNEVLTGTLNYLKTQLGQSTIQALPGSANIDGTGFQISSPDQRRKI